MPTTTMNPSREVRALEAIQFELGEMLDAIDRDGARYARQYLHGLLDGSVLPHKPPSLHPLVARWIRELVMDEAAVR